MLAQRGEVTRIEYHGFGSLHQRHQLAAVQDQVGIGGVVSLSLHARIGGQRVAEHPEQALARRAFELELLGSDPAVAQRNPPVFEVQGINHPVAIEPVIVTFARRIERFGSVAKEHPGKVTRQLAINDQIGRSRLKTNWLVMPGQIGMIEKRLSHCCNNPEL